MTTMASNAALSFTLRLHKFSQRGIQLHDLKNQPIGQAACTHILKELDKTTLITVCTRSALVKLIDEFTRSLSSSQEGGGGDPIALCEVLGNVFNMFVEVRLPQDVTPEDFVKTMYEVFGRFFEKCFRTRDRVLSRCLFLSGSDGRFSRFVWLGCSVTLHQAVCMREALVFELIENDGDATVEQSECRWHELISYMCYSLHDSKGVPLPGASNVVNCATCENKRTVRSTCIDCNKRGVLPCAQNVLHVQGVFESFATDEHLSAEFPSNREFNFRPYDVSDPLELYSLSGNMFTNSCDDDDDGTNVETMLQWSRPPGTPFPSMVLASDQSASSTRVYPTGQLTDFFAPRGGGEIACTDIDSGDPKGAKRARVESAAGQSSKQRRQAHTALDAYMLKLLQSVIHQCFPNHRRTIVSSTSVLYDSKKRSFRVHPVGHNSHYCNRFMGEHIDSRIVFHVSESGVTQSCYSSDKIGNTECKDLRPVVARLPPLMRRTLFPSSKVKYGGGLMDAKAAFGSTYHLMHLVHEKNKAKIQENGVKVGMKPRKNIFGHSI